ncbi:hypothetical protein GUJ93_ZPchr0007g3519 [Zizania palustris]|uniref:Receptor-like serine/threonine-protein kinase n=1 Tax=Zizania palustris TaxID=103762 RepID=A0A8J5T5E0_ZIZPA|nr:hypothetical protein GUJ93_ZPchr0007g3519 [Zizania palustris]
MTARTAIAALALLLLCGVIGRVGAAATLSQGQSLRGKGVLVSANGEFQAGFFTPTGCDPGKVYFGVTYARSTELTAPWVANRDAPVSAASAYSATVTRSGELQVREGKRVVWRTGTSASSSRGNHTLTIGDDGNLKLSGSDGADTDAVWQSFQHPADTFIPGMSIALDRRNGAFDRTLFTSWRSAGDPATGDFTLGLDPSAQLYIWRSQGGKNSTYWRSGQWTGTNFVGIPWRSLYVYGFKLTGDPLHSGDYMSYNFAPFNSSLFRFVLQPNGTETCYMLLATGSWETVWFQPAIPCHEYNRCGPNAECAAGDGGQAACTCLKGFKPKSEAEYSSRNWTQGCVRSAPLTCSQSNTTAAAAADDVFAELQGVKLPDFAVWGSAVGDGSSCKQACLGNCSCGAYSYSTGSCLMWGQELVDIYHFPRGDGYKYNLYVKVPPSVLETSSERGRWTTAIVVVVVIVVAIVLVACGLLTWKCRRRIKEKLKADLPLMMMRSVREAKQDFSGPKQPDHEESDESKNCELPLLAFDVLAVATDHFSDKNKLGEGGFGHVYKGRLPGGEEIAVKRLSRSSGQGLEEFKNEVILIAKLQHRNLVRLLGCCIQCDEKILVYEYMPNKSLDAFLFDPAKRGLLDWKTRFHIIEGIARGLLYLHRDSRLRVVHRDLKASNILLDHDMNPKISDFGMARIFGGDQNQVNTNRVVGTLGYMSPEYAMEGLFSVRSDVYSFGILILEIITGQKNSSFHHMEDSLNIVGYAWQLWNGDKGEQLIDPAIIRGTCPPVRDEALRCVHMALLCVQDHAHDRPDIPYVVLALGSDSSVLPMPRPPTFTLQCTSSSSGTDMYNREKEESFSANDLTVTILQGR